MMEYISREDFMVDRPSVVRQFVGEDITNQIDMHVTFTLSCCGSATVTVVMSSTFTHVTNKLTIYALILLLNMNRQQYIIYHTKDCPLVASIMKFMPKNKVVTTSNYGCASILIIKRPSVTQIIGMYNKLYSMLIKEIKDNE